jgi:hypothetical protein
MRKAIVMMLLAVTSSSTAAAWAKNYFWLIAALALACFAPGVAAQVSSGTAFAVAPGLLITNQHVVAGCSSIEILAADGHIDHCGGTAQLSKELGMPVEGPHIEDRFPNRVPVTSLALSGDWISPCQGGERAI